MVALLLGVVLATAGPAAAVDDPGRPDARVTHGPSCRPGGLVVEVVAGTSPYFVRLATTRTPSGEDDATLGPGETAVLRTGDVANGETIDGRLEFTARDGTGARYVDELEEYSFTRPAKLDCDAIAEPAAPTSSTGSRTTAAGAAAPMGSADGGAPQPATAGATDVVPVAAATLALLATVGGFCSVVGRRRAVRRPIGSV
jgi:hypothetical protein